MLKISFIFFQSVKMCGAFHPHSPCHGCVLQSDENFISSRGSCVKESFPSTQTNKMQTTPLQAPRQNSIKAIHTYAWEPQLYQYSAYYISARGFAY